MKRLFCLLLIFSVVLCLCACGVNVPSEPIDVEPYIPEPIPEVEQHEVERYVAYKSTGKTNDLLTIEEVVLIPEYLSDYDYYCTWKVHDKNTSGRDLVMGESGIKIWYHYLDEDGNIMYDGNIVGDYVNKSELSDTNDTINSFMDEWIKESRRPYGWTKEESQKMKTIKIYGYCLDLGSTPDYEFEEPIIINLGDYFEW